LAGENMVLPSCCAIILNKKQTGRGRGCRWQDPEFWLARLKVLLARLKVLTVPTFQALAGGQPLAEHVLLWARWWTRLTVQAFVGGNHWPEREVWRALTGGLPEFWQPPISANQTARFGAVPGMISGFWWRRRD